MVPVLSCAYLFYNSLAKLPALVLKAATAGSLRTSMNSLQLVTFGIIIALVVLVWGGLMAFSPQKFWNLAKVDWNADVIDTRDRRKRHFVRIAGWMIIALALLLLIGVIIAALK